LSGTPEEVAKVDFSTTPLENSLYGRKPALDGFDRADGVAAGRRRRPAGVRRSKVEVLTGGKDVESVIDFQL
jgi:hypothetical protein